MNVSLEGVAPLSYIQILNSYKSYLEGKKWFLIILFKFVFCYKLENL
jgi:hypothetical protein